MIAVCGSKPRYVPSSDLAGIPQICATPGKALAAAVNDYQISHHTGMAPVSVRKGMDRCEAMMKPNGDFVRWIRPCFYPRAGIGEEHL